MFPESEIKKAVYMQTAFLIFFVVPLVDVYLLIGKRFIYF